MPDTWTPFSWPSALEIVVLAMRTQDTLTYTCEEMMRPGLFRDANAHAIIIIIITIIIILLLGGPSHASIRGKAMRVAEIGWIGCARPHLNISFLLTAPSL